MKAFFKQNIVLLLGITTPLIIIVLFSLSAWLAQQMVAEPAYDFLYATHDGYQSAFQESGGKVSYTRNPYYSGGKAPLLYRFHVKSGKSEEIAYTLPMEMNKVMRPATPASVNVNITVDPLKLPSAAQAQETSRIVSQITARPSQPEKINYVVKELENLKVDGRLEAPDGYIFNNSQYRNGGLLTGGYDQRYGASISKQGKSVIVPGTAGNDYNDTSHFIGWIIP
jgi:hypothetical protein